MDVRKLIAAAAVAAALPMAFAQSGPAPLRGEAWDLAGAPTQARQDLQAYGAKGSGMPDVDFVSGDAGYVPHQHQFMEQNELRARAMGNRGVASTAAGAQVQSRQEVQQYQRVGG